MSTRASSSKAFLSSRMVLRRACASAVWFFNQARRKMFNLNADSLKLHRASLLIASVMVRVHWSASWPVRIVERVVSK